ncbi:MAG: zinc ribbon domain-containing protein, partial [Acidobacteriales bacterium]|nr:zinc ribbon domain-containing protein [Terriglobales bacterium]
MFCNQCGNNNPDTSRFCNNCGQPLGVEAQAAPPSAYPPMPSDIPLPDAKTDGK